MIVRYTGYRVVDSPGVTGVRCFFVSDNPAPYNQSDFTVDLTDAEANVTSINTLRTTVTNKLQRKYGAALDLGSGEWVGQGIANLTTMKNETFTVTT